MPRRAGLLRVEVLLRGAGTITSPDPQLFQAAMLGDPRFLRPVERVVPQWLVPCETPFNGNDTRCSQKRKTAASTLLKVMVDPTTPAGTRVRAADTVLDHSAR